MRRQPPGREAYMSLHRANFPDEDVIWVDGWIRSLRWLVSYRGLTIQDRPDAYMSCRWSLSAALGGVSTLRRGPPVDVARRGVGESSDHLLVRAVGVHPHQCV